MPDLRLILICHMIMMHQNIIRLSNMNNLLLDLANNAHCNLHMTFVRKMQFGLRRVKFFVKFWVPVILVRCVDIDEMPVITFFCQGAMGPQIILYQILKDMILYHSNTV